VIAVFPADEAVHQAGAPPSDAKAAE
jgi:hypothetical protein